MTLDDTTWQRVRALLVEEHYERRIARGTIDRGRLRELIGRDVDRQAAERPGWKQQQADRLLGEVKRPGARPTCPHCGITFDPRPADHDLDTTRGVPLHERWTNGAVVVAVPPPYADAYQRLGYRPLDEAETTRLERHARIEPDQPTRGPDGLLYCRASCADREPTTTLEQYVLDHPEAARYSPFLHHLTGGDPVDAARAGELAPALPGPLEPQAITAQEREAVARRARAALDAHPHRADQAAE